MLSNFCKIVCGVSPSSMTAVTTDEHQDDSKLGSCSLSSPLLFPRARATTSSRSSELRSCMSHPSAVISPEVHNDDDGAVLLPCLVFGSEDGYRAFSLAEGHMQDGDVAMRLARGRRYVPSPYGGKVFVTDMCGRYPCHLVDPFSGEVTPLPDLPVPFSEEEPMPVIAHAQPEPRLSTDDGFAWDWSPRGVMGARGDTAFFCETAGGGEWTPVHRSRQGSSMTVNYRAGFFFLFELGSLRTTVIDAETLEPSTEIDPPPRLHDIKWAFLVASADDVLLLVRRRSRNRYTDAEGTTFFQAYRARHRGQWPDTPIRWEPVTDIGDRAVFVDHAHGFTVRAGQGGAMRNCLYRPRIVELEEAGDEPSRRNDAALVVLVSPLRDLSKTELVEGSEVLRRCKVQHPIWGGGYWIMRNHGSSPSS